MAGSLDECRDAGRRLMPQLVDQVNGLARSRSMIAFHRLMTRLGFRLVKNEVYGPPGGHQLFYRLGDLDDSFGIIARAKSRGDARGFREGQPHFSIAVFQGAGMDWQDERAKFNRQGQLAAKSMTTTDRFNPIDFQSNPQRFVVIMGGRYDGPGADAWAGRTHFPFPDGFDDAGAADLQA